MTLENNSPKSILVAGVGNIFLGDDAFGCEVIRELSTRSLSPTVRVVDFGIRSYDLAYALLEQYEAIILVDAMARGESAGTLFLLELDLKGSEGLKTEAMGTHGLDLPGTLRMAWSLGAHPQRLYLVGCEPVSLMTEDGRIGLSDAVKATVPQAIEMIQSLIAEILDQKQRTGLVPA